jgi:hypothetical protein
MLLAGRDEFCAARHSSPAEWGKQFPRIFQDDIRTEAARAPLASEIGLLAKLGRHDRAWRGEAGQHGRHGPGTRYVR